jgi:hypothetical protein
MVLVAMNAALLPSGCAGARSELAHATIDVPLAASCASLHRSTVALVRAGDGAELARFILALARAGALREVFASLVDAGHYEAIASLLARAGADSDRALKALADARPDYGVDEMNAATLESIAARTDWDRFRYDFLVVPGFTPLGARRPLTLAEIPVAQQRLELALADFQARGLAPYILVSGGSVHPSGTRNNEALMMRDFLVSRGVPPERILVDPFARHSTTNLRNAGRVMLSTRRVRALIVTGFDGGWFDQAFYFAHPVLSTFRARCRRELGYEVGALERIDEHHVSFRPAPEAMRSNYRDPLDA